MGPFCVGCDPFDSCIHVGGIRPTCRLNSAVFVDLDTSDSYLNDLELDNFLLLVTRLTAIYTYVEIDLFALVLTRLTNIFMNAELECLAFDLTRLLAVYM